MIRCINCNRDITRSMKIYPHGYSGGTYCYDCAYQSKAKISHSKAREPTDEDWIKTMYSEGYKPSFIAAVMKISTKKVYEVLTNG